ncbi:RNA methyltransferase [Maribacter sp. 2307UL18-2]|uniref:RNA methyltransferase n=1 Tax=Maribacter sp. 2307UL18-2 TaxID=3386274 RepID=UPI0039BCFFCC
MRKLKNEELSRLDTEAFKKAEKMPVTIVLDNIRSLNNIGSVFRTADAFLIEKIYLCGITATPPHKDIRKTALGATESMAWEYRESTLQLVAELKEQGRKVFAVEQAEGATQMQDLQPKRSDHCVFIFGNEVKGVAQEVVDQSDEVIEIPQFGTKHSLNISVSVGMVIWDSWSKLQSQK